MKHKFGIESIRNFLEDLVDDVRISSRKLKLPEGLTEENRIKYKKQRRRGIAILTGCSFGAAVLICALVFLLFLAGSAIAKIPQRIQNITVYKEPETEEVYEEADVTIGSTGTVFLHGPILNAYQDDDGNYDFSPIFTYIEPYYSSYDFMTCEFEGTLSGGSYSGYPRFRSPDVIIQNIHDSGVDLQMLASNHAYDDGSASFHRTMDTYDSLQIAYTGVHQKGADPWYLANLSGICVGFLDYTYEAYGDDIDYPNLNGIPIEEQDQPLINSFSYEDLNAFYEEVKGRLADMRNAGAEFIIMNLHWGYEYNLTEADIQRVIAQNLCDLGVDAIIGGHTHCEEPIDVFTSLDGSHQMFCIFSTGNTLCNQRRSLMQNSMPSGHTEDGVVVILTLHRDSTGEVSIKGVDLLPTWVCLYEGEESNEYYILPLDDVDNIEILTGMEDIVDDARESYERTMDVLGEGLEKAQEAFR